MIKNNCFIPTKYMHNSYIFIQKLKYQKFIYGCKQYHPIKYFIVSKHYSNLNFLIENFCKMNFKVTDKCLFKRLILHWTNDKRKRIIMSMIVHSFELCVASECTILFRTIYKTSMFAEIFSRNLQMVFCPWSPSVIVKYGPPIHVHSHSLTLFPWILFHVDFWDMTWNRLLSSTDS